MRSRSLGILAEEESMVIDKVRGVRLKVAECCHLGLAISCNQDTVVARTSATVRLGPLSRERQLSSSLSVLTRMA